MAVFDKILFEITHFLLWVFTLIQCTLSSWRRKPIQIRPSHRKNTFRRCHDERSNLGKLPYHLSLVFSEGNISFQDVANIIVWCAAVGISYLSIYDSEGMMKMHSRELTYHIAERQKELLEKEGSEVTVETNSSLRCHTKQNNSDEIDVYPLKSSKKFHIQLHLLGPEDGQPCLVRAAKQYCTEESLYQGTDSKDIDLSQMLQETYNFPDPDLILKFGTISSLLGFLPWQIRLTEIISYPSHHGLDYKSFLQILHIYARTEQRFGK